MATQFWLDNGSTTLSFDSNVTDLEIGGSERAYKVTDFAGSNGGYITGFGTYSPKTISISRKEKAESGDATAWNSLRNDFMSWITTPATTELYLYILNGEGTLTTKGRVYPKKIGSDKYKFYMISEMRKFDFILPVGYMQDTSSSSGSEAVVGASESTFTVANDGILDTPSIFTYLPTGAETSFQCEIADDFGFRLEGNFSSGVLISYDTSDGSLEIGGVAQNPNQFLTGGGIFTLAPGSQSVYVTCSGAGTFGYQFYERYI